MAKAVSLLELRGLSLYEVELMTQALDLIEEARNQHASS